MSTVRGHSEIYMNFKEDGMPERSELCELAEHTHTHADEKIARRDCWVTVSQLSGRAKGSHYLSETSAPFHTTSTTFNIARPSVSMTTVSVNRVNIALHLSLELLCVSGSGSSRGDTHQKETKESIDSHHDDR